MKRYIYKAEFCAYDRIAIHYWEEEEKINMGVIENRILNICNTSVIKRITERDTKNGKSLSMLYKENKPHEQP